MTDSRQDANRLGAESSPYLLLHAHNPVDWYPWGSEALAKARSEDKPIFLSVGYSTCYWCHVMERESFSAPAIAELMNRHFVNIKVDREERPELDEIYMVATQILGRHGGWPNSVFLTPDLKPFFAGTYFPPEDRPGQPGFASVLESLAAAWRERRPEVEEQATGVATAMRRYLEEALPPPADLPSPALAESCFEDLRRRFDAAWGGFGGAPKFPTPSNLMLLEELAAEVEGAALMLDRTLEAMARGGIFDQLAGGFHRYATDREWRIPHFEKMLYDNGLLLEIYSQRWRQTLDPETARVVRATVGFLLEEMTDPQGALWSAIDAETDGHEGAYYVWTRQELKEVLGEEDFGFLASLMGFSGPPPFEGHYFVLHLPESLALQAERRRMTLDDLHAQIDPLRQRLLEARGRRRRPATDDKILADWNGMAIAGLAAAGEALDEPDWVDRGIAAAEFLLATLRPQGRLHHSWRQGRCGPAAFLADYAFLVHGLLALHRVTAAPRWLETAIELAGEQQARLADPAGGFFVAARSTEVLFRSKEVMDGATPGANAVAALNLVELARRTGDSRWASDAERALRAFAGFLEQHPGAVKTLAVAHRRFHRLTASTAEVGAQDSADGSPVRTLQEEARKVVQADLRLVPSAQSQSRSFLLRLEISPGWHLYAPGSEVEGLEALTVSGENVTLSSVELPAGRPLESAEGAPRVYEGAVEIRGELEEAGETPRRLRIGFQACDQTRCLPRAELVLPVEF